MKIKNAIPYIILLLAAIALVTFIFVEWRKDPNVKADGLTGLETAYLGNNANNANGVALNSIQETPSPEPTNTPTPQDTPKVVSTPTEVPTIGVTTTPTSTPTPTLTREEQIKADICTVWGADCEIGYQIAKGRNNLLNDQYKSIQGYNVGLFTVNIMRNETSEYFTVPYTKETMTNLLLNRTNNIKYSYYFYQRYGYAQTLKNL